MVRKSWARNVGSSEGREGKRKKKGKKKNYRVTSAVDVLG